MTDLKLDGDAFSALALSLDEDRPSPAVWARVAESLATANRFEDFIDRVAKLCAVPTDIADSLLAAIDGAARWMQGPADGVSLFHIDESPLSATAIVGFVKIEPGGVFPRHGHAGDEVVLILQGSYRDDGGNVVRRGDVVQQKPGATHELLALDGPPLVYLNVVDKGILFGTELIDPNDPRA